MSVSQSSKHEPTSMTLLDLILLVVGVALAFVLIRSPRNSLSFWFLTRAQVALFWVVSIFAGTALAVSVVSFGRICVYRRGPRPAEWLAILVALANIIGRQFTWDEAVEFLVMNVAFVGSLANSLAGLHWILGLSLVLVVVPGLFLISAARRVLPPWGRTVLLCLVALVVYLGPISVFGTHGGDLLAPSEGFGAGGGWILYRGATGLVGYLPFGLFFGVPTIAVLSDRLRGGRWAWNDWVAANASVLVFLSEALMYRAEFPPMTWGWLAERLMLMAWFVLVGLLSRLILIRLGPWWDRWFGETSGRAQVSEPARTP